MLEVGAIQKPHGLRGEVIVSLSTDRVERLDVGSVLHTDDGPLTVLAAAPHQHRWRVRFEGCESREDADELRGLVLRAEPIEDPDAWFVHDLIDAEVVTSAGVSTGRCVAIVDNPAHDLLELDDGTLVPLPFVVDIDFEATPVRIEIDPPAGLLDPAE